jgi:anti-sigma factor ChrR (cupin superfamily)
MMRKFFGHSEDSAALFALGSLRGEEKSTFEEHVQQGCAACEEDLRELANVVEILSLAAPATEPSIRVRQRLLESLAVHSAEPTQREGSLEVHQMQEQHENGILLHQRGLLISRSSEMPWEQVAPGFSRKTLFVDPVRKYTTCLLRVEAGGRYPSHRHADVEELLVLEGELTIHGVSMRAGDYCRAEADSIHEETFTESGCLLLQMTSQLDQIQE